MADNTTGTEIGIIQIESKNLKNIDNFLKGDENITRVECPFPHVTNAVSAFENCINLESFKGDLNSLTNGTQMFHNCEKLGTFTGKLPSLSIGKSMFYNTNLANFTEDLTSLTDGTDMFKDCENLKTFSSNMGSLTTYSGMFDGTSLNIFKTNEINTADTGSTFMQGIALTSSKSSLRDFYCNLPNMTNTDSMFKDYTSLEWFESYLPNVSNADYMFQNCSSLITVYTGGNDDAQSTNQWQSCSDMFRNCTNLNDFGIKNLNLIKNVQNGGNMFRNTGITTIPTDWKFSHLVFANCMFQDTKIASLTIAEDTFPNLTTDKFREKFPDAPSWTFASITKNMFRSNTLKKIKFDVSKIPYGAYMFAYCPNLTTCESAEFANGGNYDHMFRHSKFDRQSAQIIHDAAVAAKVADVDIGVGFDIKSDAAFISTNNLVKNTNDDRQWYSTMYNILFISNV